MLYSPQEEMSLWETVSTKCSFGMSMRNFINWLESCGLQNNLMSWDSLLLTVDFTSCFMFLLLWHLCNGGLQAWLGRKISHVFFNFYQNIFKTAVKGKLRHYCCFYREGGLQVSSSLDSLVPISEVHGVFSMRDLLST